MTMNDFPQYACRYSLELALKSKAFARQVFLSRKEFQKETEFSADPFSETGEASKCHGLKQRFPDRVLIMTSDRCFMNCRHCTRRGLLGRTSVVKTSQEIEECVNYVKAHKKVRDVLLSGGDALTLSDKKIMEFVDAFSSLDQIDVVRVCTRALATNPQRVTRSLAKKLGASGKVWVNTQFNCADEVTEEAREAAKLLVNAGIPVSCQTVLLKGVNDSGPKMLKLLKALSASRIRPYYVFMCDPVVGTRHFHVSVEKAREIERYCAERIGGLSLPRFVADFPKAKRKIPIDMI